MVDHASIGHINPTMLPGVNTCSVVFDWADVPGVTRYRFRVRPVGGSWNVSTVIGSQRTTTLTPNTNYEVMIRVYISNTTQGEYTQSYTFTTPAFVPLPTCNQPSVNATKTNDTIKLSWNSVQYATQYQVQVRLLGGMNWGGTTVNTTNYSFKPITNNAYEYQVRSNCTGTTSPWSSFTNIDTITDAICTAPTGLYNSGNTFYWTPNKYAEKTQIQHRLIGTQNWGGTIVTGNSWTNPILWGRHEWRVRSTCYATTNKGWTSFSPIMTTNFIPNPNSFEEFQFNVAYPNPANNTIMYNGKIKIQDMTGRIVLVGENEVDVNHLPNGLYFVNGMKHIIQH
jgi:hypothetical protein